MDMRVGMPPLDLAAGLASPADARRGKNMVVGASLALVVARHSQQK
jgi:hypothetical protein